MRHINYSEDIMIRKIDQDRKRRRNRAYKDYSIIVYRKTDQVKIKSDGKENEDKVN